MMLDSTHTYKQKRLSDQAVQSTQQAKAAMAAGTREPETLSYETQNLAEANQAFSYNLIQANIPQEIFLPITSSQSTCTTLSLTIP